MAHIVLTSLALYAQMVEDGHGHGKVVYYAATSSEDYNHI